MRASNGKMVLWTSVLVVLLGSCSLDPWKQGTDPSWKFPDAGQWDGGESDADSGGPCVPETETCDGSDNDCDGEIDNVAQALLLDDVNNCGDCFNVCDLSESNAVAGCQDGTCIIESCYPNYWDLNGDAGDGCEYQCFGTLNATEVCNNRDDNCDGQVDEGYDLSTDPMNCGMCGRVCAFFKGNGSCVGGQCVLQSCRGGYVDKDGDPDNGCECLMGVTEGATVCDELNPVVCGTGEVCTDSDSDGVSHCGEVPLDGCDGVDNDCDGVVDEDATAIMGTADCYTHPVGCTETAPGVYTCVGECEAGQPTCVGGNVICGGQVPPSGEICDNLDNDCNGVVDDGYDKQSDPANCGACGVQCQALVANAVPGCVSGQCTIVACLPGFHDINNDPTDGCEYACTLTNGGVENCSDQIDNDCNGLVDDGFDYTSDPSNCGSCGTNCSTNKPFGTVVQGCVSSACVYACQQDYYDLDGDLSQGTGGNGCEYFCVVTGGGTESCDGVDNDCNGVVDDGYDLDTDPVNCGACGTICSALVGADSVATGCVDGICQFACATNHYDLNGDVSLGAAGDGCEYGCVPTGAEVCDGADNDCDGQTDEGSGGAPLSQVCYTPGYGPTTGCTSAGVCVGNCQEGVQLCTGGGWGDCNGEIIPQVELCDGADNDCDGQTDEDYDVTSDVNNCGACGTSCWTTAPTNAYPSACTGGSCVYACSYGFNDLNGDLQTGGDGCEYTCPQVPPGVEFCDGVDNDCDGQVDQGLTAPVGICFQGVDGPIGVPGTAENNPCKGVVALCQDPDGAGALPYGWYCQWPAAVENNPLIPNQLLGYETLCNGADGDCNGVPDDDFPLLGQACDDGGIGECKGTGNYVCTAAEDDVECQITSQGATPQPEECNGLDDDCDGTLDNDTPGDMVNVVQGGLDFWIDVYEASRPDATPLGGGVMGHQACSEPDRIPWSNISWADAEAACTDAGKRLCTEEEWQAACEGPLALVYPYGNTYDPDACNGDDYDHDCSTPDDDEVLATGTAYGCPPPGTSMCVSPHSVYDLSGNLMEWTETQVGVAPVTYRIRGGSYFTVANGLTCGFDFISADPAFRYDDLGFRCCSDTFPP